MKRVVVTGMGIWSCIGQDLPTVTESLKQGRSGIVFDPEWVEYGLRSGIVGAVPLPNLKPYLSRRTRQFMSEDAGYAYMATRQAFDQAGIGDEYLRKNEVGIIFGNDGNSHQHEYAKIMEQEREPILVGYNAAFRVLSSNAVANMAAIFHLRGVNMTIGAACASSSYAIGVACMFIQQGIQDVILVGGGSEVRCDNIFNVVNDAISQQERFNAIPTKASRPFDKASVGCITTGGGAALVIEEYEHALKRGAKIIAEIVGYGFAGDGFEDLTQPQWDTDYRAMQNALQNAKMSINDMSLIHSRADSSYISDQAEAIALSHLCAKANIPISSTESIAGHSGWVAGASRTIYSVLMMQNNFIAPTINLEHPIDEAKDLNIITETTYTPIDTILVNSAGLGGSHCAIVLRKVK